jgi:hypothetical protein
MTLNAFKKIKIKLDTANQQIMTDTLRAVEGDNHGRQLELTVTDAGALADLTGYVAILYWYRMFDDTKGMHSFNNSNAEQGVFSLDFPSGMLKAGKVKCTIALLNSEQETVINSRPFYVKVDESVADDDALEDEDTFTLLNEILFEWHELPTKIDNALAQFESDANEKLASVDLSLDAIANIGELLDGLDGKADKSELELKADKTELDFKADKTELDGKADVFVVDDLGETLVALSDELEGKADKTELDTKANVADLELKADAADLSALQDVLDAKANLDDLALKADVTALDTKADLSALAGKANVADLDAKADREELDNKANIAELDLKANVTDLETKANTSDLAFKVDKVEGKQLTDENYTADEKAKLAGLESSHFKGTYATAEALADSVSDAREGDYAYVGEEGADEQLFIYDATDGLWLASGATGSDTPAMIKEKYESNDDTNAFTDADLEKLNQLRGVDDVSLFGAIGVTGHTTVATSAGKEGYIALPNPTPLFNKREFNYDAPSMTNSGTIITTTESPRVGDFLTTRMSNGSTYNDMGWLIRITKITLSVSGATIFYWGVALTDQASAAKIKYEQNSNTNAFTDAEKTKLSGLGAQVPFSKRDGLVAFWDFAETAVPFYSKINGVNEYPLEKLTGNTTKVATGVQFAGNAILNVTAANLGKLNIGKYGNEVTVLAKTTFPTDVQINMFTAGIWDEGTGRSYGLFTALNDMYGGYCAICGHVSKVGGATPGYPYNRDYTATRSWAGMTKAIQGMTYDGSQIKAYLDASTDYQPTFTDENSQTYSKAPYNIDDGINGAGTAPFTVGGVKLGTGSYGNYFKGIITWLAVFDRALSADEIAHIRRETADDTTIYTHSFQIGNQGTLTTNTAYSFFQSWTMYSGRTVITERPRSGDYGLASDTGVIKAAAGSGAIGDSDRNIANSFIRIKGIAGVNLNEVGSWQMTSNSNFQTTYQLMFKIGGQWYISTHEDDVWTDTFNGGGGGFSDASFTSMGRTMRKNINREAGHWATFNFNEDNLGSIGNGYGPGETLTTKLPAGEIEELGFYVPNNITGNIRWRNFKLYSDKV